MQFLDFTFSDFWHFIGVLILIATIFGNISLIKINKKS